MTLSACALKSWAWQEKPSRDYSHLMYHNAFSKGRVIDLYDVFLNETLDVVNASEMKNFSEWGYRMDCKTLILKVFPSGVEWAYPETRLWDYRPRGPLEALRLLMFCECNFSSANFIQVYSAVQRQWGWSILPAYFYCFILIESRVLAVSPWLLTTRTHASVCCKNFLWINLSITCNVHITEQSIMQS